MTSSLFASWRGEGEEIAVLLHGFGAGHGVWNGVASALSGTARTLAYDLPGHGASLAVPDAGSPRKAAQAIAADMAAHNLLRVHLVGHSMGGAIAMLTALAAPERVASLTLLAPGGVGPEIAAALLRRYARAADPAELAACLAAMSGPGATTPADTIEILLAMRRQPGQVDKLAEIAASITRDDRQGAIPAALLASLAMPVTVLWGMGDPVLPASQAQSLPDRFVVQRLARAGHMLIEEAPEAVVAAIRSTIGRTAR
ncbi:MAG: alpha/beta fold hydrolase [Mesorhizobium sp.]|nr:alpha/beta fold hydrolase [Mesorhizobium sp.]MBN9243503.1 alpha/beta fold hydrolase [Mesorhizobium sp.]